MKRHIISAASITAAALVSNNVMAYEFSKPVQVPVTVTKSHHGLIAGVSQKEVTIQRINLSKTEQEAIANRQIHTTPLKDPKLPIRADIGMNGVPVLDQGRHGSCVTFAISAAIDAVLGKGDYISQLCNLELGSHLEKYGYVFSGWDGSYGPVVLDQMMHFGIINKENQHNLGCAGVKEYPLKDGNDKGNEMSLGEFKSSSEDLNKRLYWTHIFSNDQLFDWKTADPGQMEAVLQQVKHALIKGNRVAFGTFLILNGTCRSGACATHQSSGDTWALSSDLETPPYETGGHEMIIIGYDDTAVAFDQHGGKHTGLLKLRNSWGDDVGDNGNYYMSYDFFKKYANEVQEIIEIKK